MKGLNLNPENGTIRPEVKPDYLLNIKVSHELNEHEVVVPCNSTFGDLKSVIVQKFGVEPETHKFLFKGKEKEEDEDLHTAGVKDNAKVLLMEDTAHQQKSFDGVKETSVVSKGDAAAAQVREEIDKIHKQLAALQAVKKSGTKVDDFNIMFLTYMLRSQLLKLESIEAEGEGRVQRKMEVRPVQSFVETKDIRKSRNSNHFSNGNNTVSVANELKTFEPGCESASAVSTGPSSAPAAASLVPITETTPSLVPSTAPSSTPTHIHIHAPSSTPTPTDVHIHAPSLTPTPTHIHIHASSTTPAPTHIYIHASSMTPAPTHIHIHVSSTTPAPTGIHAPSSTPVPTPIDMLSSTLVPIHIHSPSSTPVPRRISSQSSSPVPIGISSQSPTSVPIRILSQSSTPVPIGISTQSSTPIPLRMQSSTPPVPISVPASTLRLSYAPSFVPSSTNITEDWEYFH